MLSNIRIAVDPNKTIHTMAGGAGACWHTAGPTAFWYHNLVNRANRNARGSAYGGNPPLAFEQAWKDLLGHAQWLGFNFMRLELDMRMYEPERGRFDWENSEMRTLFRALDYCEQQNVDVFLTQMSQDVEWNAHAGVSRLQSAPKSLPDFVEGIATLMEELVKRRGYRCIRWLCLSNEPGFPACWWMGPDRLPADLMPAVRAVRAELDRRDIRVPLSGPDWCDMEQWTPDFDLKDPAWGALDVHHYKQTPSVDLIQLWAGRARARGISFFQSEFGSWNGDDPFANPMSSAPKSYSNQLLNAAKFIGGLNAGVDGFTRWSFVNRGDLDGEWQLVRTWDRNKWEYFERVTPEPIPYYSYGILTRFLPKNAEILPVEGAAEPLAAAAVRSRKRDVTLYLLNRSESDAPVHLHLPVSSPLWKYQVTETAIEKPAFQLDPSNVSSAHEIRDNLPAASITVYSTYFLEHARPGIITD